MAWVTISHCNMATPPHPPPALPMDVVYIILELEPSLIVAAMSVCREWRNAVYTLCRMRKVPSPMLLQRVLTGAPLYTPTKAPLFTPGKTAANDELQRLVAAGREDVLVWLLPRVARMGRPRWMVVRSPWWTRGEQAWEAVSLDASTVMWDGSMCESTRGLDEMIFLRRQTIVGHILAHDMTVVAQIMLRDTACRKWAFALLCRATTPAMQAVVLKAAEALDNEPDGALWEPGPHAFYNAASVGHAALASTLLAKKGHLSCGVLDNRMLMVIVHHAAILRAVLQVLPDKHLKLVQKYVHVYGRRSDADPQCLDMVRAAGNTFAFGLFRQRDLVQHAHLVDDRWGNTWLRNTGQDGTTWLDVLNDAAAMARNRDAFAKRFHICARHAVEDHDALWSAVGLPPACVAYTETYVNQLQNVVLVSHPLLCDMPSNMALNGVQRMPPMYHKTRATLVHVTPGQPQAALAPAFQSTLTYSRLHPGSTLVEIKQVMRAFTSDERCRRCVWFGRLADGDDLRVVAVRAQGDVVGFIVADVEDGPHDLTIVFDNDRVPHDVRQFSLLVRMLLHDIAALHTAHPSTPRLTVVNASGLYYLLLGCGWSIHQRICLEPPTTDVLVGPRVDDPVRASVLRQQLMDGPVQPLSLLHDMAALTVAVQACILVNDVASVKRLALAQLAKTTHNAKAETDRVLTLTHIEHEDVRVMHYW